MPYILVTTDEYRQAKSITKLGLLAIDSYGAFRGVPALGVTENWSCAEVWSQGDLFPHISTNNFIKDIQHISHIPYILFGA